MDGRRLGAIPHDSSRPGPGSLDQGRGHRVPAALLVVMLAAASFVGLAGRAGAAPGRAVEENRIATGDLGVTRPTGIAWDPVADVLWVGEPGDAALVGISRDGGEVRDVLRTDVDPATATVDATGDLVSTDRARVSSEDDAGMVTTRDIPVRDPTAIATDPASGDVVVLDAEVSSLVRVGSDGDVTEVELDDAWAGDGLDAVAVDPSTGLVNVADWSADTVVAVDAQGEVVGSRTVESESLVDPGAMTFAPTADSTDDADATSLYVVDAGSEETSGGVVELSLAAAVEAAAIDDVAELVRTTDLSAYDPPSPDPAGVTWLADLDRLLISDSEVNEMAIFEGANLFQATRAGSLVRTGVTLPWSNEPTGVSHDLGNGRLFVSDDRSTGKLHTVRPGPDGRFGTTDDAVTTATMGSFGFGTIDAEDVAYHAASDTVFVVDGVNAEVWRISPGPDGVFTGGGSTGDDTISRFDLARHGIQDPEGIVHNVFDDTLLVADRRTDLVHELTLAGGLIRIIDISAAGARTPAGITLAPSSDGLGTSMYVVDRGVDNDSDPDENDGRLHELRFPGPVGDLPPVASDDAATTVVDEAVTIDVLANDADLGGDPLSLGGVGAPSDGTAVANADQTVTYTPDPGFVGTDSFPYQVCDPDPQCDTATVTVTVLAVNAPPVAVDDAVTTGVGVARTIGVLVNDSDPEGQVLTVTGLVQPGDGTAVVNADQTVTYTPDPGFVGVDTFTYRASDGLDVSAPATVTVTVTADWDPPLEIQVSSDTDDAEEAADGTMDRGSSDLEMVQEASVQTVGVRFDGIVVPPGADVTEAWVQFEADETDATPTTLRLAFQDADDPSTFGVVPFDISSRPTLAQTVIWTPPAWNVVGERGPAQRTPDLSPVVQQLVDQPGWQSGNAMVLVVTGSGKRTAEAHDGFPALSPTLHVRFDGGGTGANTAPDVVASADATFLGQTADLSGHVADDGLPGGPLDATWSKVAGPGTVTFVDPNALDTTATFSQSGTYQLQLSVDDGELVGSDLAPVEVVAPGDTGPSTVSFGLFGDYGNGSADAAEVAAMLDGQAPDFLVTVGDNNYGPGDQDSTVGPLYADWIGNYRGVHGDGAALNAFFPALGDEDIEAGGGLADYLDFYTVPGGGHVAPAASGNERYYDVVRGPVHVFVLNPHSSEPDGRDVDSVQADWLQAGLAASTSPWNVVVVHDPPYSSNGNDTDTQWPYADWGADLVVSGDRHVYERLQVDGLTYLVSGLGGASIADPAPSLLPESQAYYRDGFGAVLAEACDSGLTVTFHSVDDGVVDTHTLGVPCGTDPTPATPTDLVATGADQAVDLAWTDVATTETGYEVERSTAGPVGPFTPAATLGVDATEWTDTGLTAEVEHCYRVRATGFASPSDWSGVACATPAVPAAPVAADDIATTDEDVAVSIDVLANDTDADGDPLTVANVSTPAHGTAVVAADGTVTYTPAANFHGVDAFTYTADDGTSASNVATVSITVVPVNDPPVAVDDTATTDEGVAVDIDVLANDVDVDGDVLTVTSVSPPTNGTAAVGADGTVEYTPAPGFVGVDTFTSTVDDGNGGTDTATATVTVTPVDDPPVAADDTATTDEDVAVTVDVLANDTDPDGAALTVTNLSVPPNGTAVVEADGTVTYTPAADFHGVDTFTYTASDGTSASDLATVTLTVTPVPDAPDAVDDAITTDEDVTVDLDLLANDVDVDGDSLTVTAVGDPSGGGHVDVQPDGTGTYAPLPDFHGVDAFTYTIDDGTGRSDTATVTVTVTPVNDPPVAVDDSATTDEDVAVVVDVLVNDVDADLDALAVTDLSTPSSGTAQLQPDGTVTYTPAPDANGIDTFTYTASDGVATSAAATVTITVTPVNDPPMARDDTADTRVGTPVTIDVLANDDDLEGPLDVASVSITTAPGNGVAAVVTGGAIAYTPDGGFSGTDGFAYRVCDAEGACATASVTVTVADDVVHQFAASETTILGAIVSGGFAATVVADGVSEVLTEQHSGGPRASRTSWLDHRWALQVVNGEAMTLEVVASRSANGEGDDFGFELSRDGGNSWQRILTVASAGAPSLHTGAMPPATTGPILVRVVDTNRTAGNSGADTVSVDQLVVRTTNPLGAVPEVALTAPDAQADEGGGTGTFRLTRSDTTGPLTVGYTVAGTATAGNDYVALPGTASFADGQAQVDVTVSPLQDTDVEGDESVELVLVVSATHTIVPPGSATTVIADDDVAAAEARATAQTTVLGSVQGGTIVSTHFDDGDVQTLREEYTQGPWRARLDHRWTFQVAAGSSVQFRARAHRLGTENMVFAWSTNGSTWTPLATVDSSTEQVLTASLPAGPARTVQVRVTDVLDDKNDVDRGSVVVDELVITATP
ncbi:Ig-like domain-containing protein [Salsipaludibacter albus]|uniref:Ig-like domain-containing protein n=1 Tax=Salsipaludibacter albus TaxID=2849650 RepID=UPI001EE4AEB0|nr:Ig-like domain-containing protein [Salsipaludibacter albus]MBY5162749.1 tandem-95 repeat protein [Salsipaludibacter albus]